MAQAESISAAQSVEKHHKNHVALPSFDNGALLNVMQDRPRNVRSYASIGGGCALVRV